MRQDKNKTPEDTMDSAQLCNYLRVKKLCQKKGFVISDSENE